MLLSEIIWNVDPIIAYFGPYSITKFVLLAFIVGIAAFLYFTSIDFKQKAQLKRASIATLAAFAFVVFVWLVQKNLGLDEELFRMPIRLGWYGLIFVSALVLGYFLLDWVMRIEGKSQRDIDSLAISVIVGVILGARLGHCFFYDPALYLANPVEILKVWEGGLASHGATIGIIIAVWLYSRKRPDQPFAWVADRLTIMIALAAIFVRLANLVNSEIYGHVTTVPWAFRFVREAKIAHQLRHPTQLYEALAYVVVFFTMLWYYNRRRTQVPQGALAGLLLIMIFTARFFIEFFKENQEAYSWLYDTFGINTGQLLSIPFVLFGIWLLYRVRQRGERIF